MDRHFIGFPTVGAFTAGLAAAWRVERHRHRRTGHRGHQRPGSASGFLKRVTNLDLAWLTKGTASGGRSGSGCARHHQVVAELSDYLCSC